MPLRPDPSVAVAAGLAALAVAQCVGQARGASATAAALLGTAAVGLGARRAEAVVVLAAASVVGQSLLRAEDPVFASFLALMAAFYLLARHRTWRAVALGAAVTAAALLLLLLRDPRPFVPVELVFPLAYFGAATAAGRLVRGRDLHAQALIEAAAREAAARERASVAEERARIARDMHDVVAHSVSLLVVQAESAAAVMPHDPVRAAAQVERVADSGRQALEELRRVLGVLRTSAEPEVVAQPGLADLRSLAGAVRDTGRSVRLNVELGLENVPAGLQLSAYRVVQESITNAVRHADAAQIDISVRRTGDQLAVEVLDDGAGGAAAGGGHGIAGMRERMQAYGGDVDAGPVRGGGWQVRATAPLDPGVITVLVVDDQELVREGLRLVLEAEPDLQVVGEAPDGDAAVREALRLRPDVVLMDIRMPGVDGLTATRRLVAGGRRAPKILVLTTFDVDEHVYEALRAGASGFLLKSAPRRHLVHAIRSVAAGDALLDPALTRRLVEDYVRRPPPTAGRPDALRGLTDREVEVLGLVARGMSNAEIASHLVLGESTIKTHVGSIFAKLGLRDRAQAVVVAYECGLVRAGG